MFDFNATVERAVVPRRRRRRLRPHAELEVAARQPRISRARRRHLRQRGGDRRRRLSLSPDLSRAGFAGFVLTADCTVRDVPQRYARGRPASGTAGAVRGAACRLGRRPQDRDGARELMLRRTVAEILSPALARAGYVELADRCRLLRTPTELVAIAKSLRESATNSALHRPLIAALEHAADGGRQWLSGLPTDVVFCTFSALAGCSPRSTGDRFADRVYRRAAAILDAALGSETRPIPAAARR